MIGIHLGLDGYHHRVARDNIGPNNIHWNLRFFKGIDAHRASLVYAHYTFCFNSLFFVMCSYFARSFETEECYCFREETPPFEIGVIVLY